MSYETSVAIIARLQHKEVLAAVKAWAEQQERAAGFGRVDDGFYASKAWVVVGHLNHGDYAALLATIRGAARQGGWGYEPVGVMFCNEDGVMWTKLLNENGIWV